MSWLSSALKNNTVKIGLALAAGYVGKEYLYGDYSSASYLPTGEVVKGKYTGENFASGILNTLGVKPFKDTAAADSFLGTAIEYMRPAKEDAFDLALKGLRANMGLPAAPAIPKTAGSQTLTTRQDFRPSPTQMFNMGNNGRALAALGNSDTQQYLAAKIRGLNIPMASALPSINTGAGAVIQTTNMRKRGYKKLGLTT